LRPTFLDGAADFIPRDLWLGMPHCVTKQDDVIADVFSDVTRDVEYWRRYCTHTIQLQLFCV